MEVAVARAARRLTGDRVVTALAALLLVLLIAVAVLGVRLGQARAAADRDAQILQAARQEIVNFTTLDYRQFDRDTARVLDGATGEFAQEFSARLPDLERLVTENEAVSEGSVLEAGLVSVDSDSAQVLVVADSEVTNVSNPEGQIRHYRIQLDLVREGDRWLTSKIEFVG